MVSGKHTVCPLRVKFLFKFLLKLSCELRLSHSLGLISTCSQLSPANALLLKSWRLRKTSGGYVHRLRKGGTLQATRNPKFQSTRCASKFCLFLLGLRVRCAISFRVVILQSSWLHLSYLWRNSFVNWLTLSQILIIIKLYSSRSNHLQISSPPCHWFAGTPLYRIPSPWAIFHNLRPWRHWMLLAMWLNFNEIVGMAPFL